MNNGDSMNSSRRWLFTFGIGFLLFTGWLNQSLSDEARTRLVYIISALCVGAVGWFVVAWLWTRPRL
jgi:hypothetical protein